jgi:hypothetical protein
VNFVVANDNSALFSVQPSLGPNGTLTYTPAANANGIATVTVRVRDDGGTVNGGVDTSAAQTLTIAVAAVNDPPTFTAGADQVVALDSGPRSVIAWATGLSAGPVNELTQSVNFIVTNGNPELFSVQPTLTPNGTLTFTPAPGASGVATVTVLLHDSGGTANGGVDTSAAQTFTVTIQPKPSLSIGDASVLEGNSGTTALVFTVSLSGQAAAPVTVSYQTLNGTASSRDYQATSGTLTFAVAETSKTVTVLVSGDTNRESNETLGVRLSNATVTITRVDGFGTILDDDS